MSNIRNRASPDQLDQSWVKVGKEDENGNGTTSAAVPAKKQVDDETLKNIKVLGSNALVGFLFGTFLQKGRVYEPSVIQNQFTFTDNVMIQMFLMGAATSQAVFASILALPEDNLLRQEFIKLKAKYLETRGKRGLKSVMLGSLLLGTGMAISGSCPGTIYAQLGSKTAGSGYVFIGSWLGYYLFSQLESTWLQKNWYGKWLPKSNQLEDYFEQEDEKHNTLFKWYVGAAVALTGVATLFHLYTPETNPYGTSNFSVLYGKLFGGNLIKDVLTLPFNLMKLPSWPAMLTGLGVGLLQIPNMMLLDNFLGSSSALGGLFAPIAPYLVKFGLLPQSSVDATCELSSWTKGSTFKSITAAVYIASMIFGARTSSYLGGTIGAAPGLLSTVARNGTNLPRVLGASTHARITQGIVGGAMILFGSRISNGCTSGNGISGFGLLSLNGLVAVPAMFGSAIIAQHVFRWLVGY